MQKHPLFGVLTSLLLAATFIGCSTATHQTAAAAELYINPQTGSDDAAGSIAKPFKSIGHAISVVQPGNTIYLREGVYREEVALRLHGTAEKPITITGYQNEKAIIDPSIAAFQIDTANAWEPYTGADAAPGEYRSTKRYPSERDMIGSLAESMFGLQTYFYAKDLRSQSEAVDWIDWDNTKESDIKPLYCGPGVWYDAQTGYIHARLSHTTLPREPNYKGATDPRNTQLIISGFDRVPLKISGAKHINLKNLTIRGGGYDTVDILFSDQISFEGLTIYATSYGVRAESLTNFKMLSCDMIGNAAPWTFRSDASKRAYPHRPWRDISRMNTHALIVTNNGREFSIFATPVNDHWEIANCKFIDAHDGVYLGGISVKFHHNFIDNMQDDGIYLSQMYPRHLYGRSGAILHVNNNVFTRTLTPLAFGGLLKDTKDVIYIYRNLIDQRWETPRGRHSVRKPEPNYATGQLMGDHGSPPWSSMYIYQNTCIMASYARRSSMSLFNAVNAERPRRVFNNILIHGGGLPGYQAPTSEHDLAADGNLYWMPNTDEKKAASYFNKYRKSADYEASKKLYEPGSSTNSLIADPMFKSFDLAPNDTNDYRLQSQSPAVGAGVVLPAEWEDSCRPAGDKRPDIGVYQTGVDVKLGPQR